MIGKDSVFIIAEAGINHNGDIETAKKLIEAAKEVGVDAIKFQTWKTENIVTTNSPKAPYQEEILGEEISQFSMLKRLELSYEEFAYLKEYCDTIQIEFMSTADEYESAKFINPYISKIKVGSAELTDWPYLAKLAKFNKEIILSTGMATLKEVKEAVQILKKNGLQEEKINILHAHTEYPSKFEDLNLNAITTLKKELNLNIGYSDHSLGIEAPIAAVALGARIIEKHFTLDCNMKGPDHKASLEPQGFQQMVQAIRNIEKALGTGIKEPSKREMQNIPYVRKSIVASRTIIKGEVFTEENITVKRPANGISPKMWDNIIGKKAFQNFYKDEIIKLEE